jgi:membrane protein DedA with SNARE-associated domain
MAPGPFLATISTETVMTLNHLLSTYGYAIVFLIVAAESLGLPLPGETILALAAISAGTTHQLSTAGVIAAAAAGATVGDNAGYGIGRWGGYRLVRRYGRYVHIDERRLKIGRYLADRHGGQVVLFGRFVSILRTYAAFLAGTTQMRWRRFLAFNAAGGIIWAVTYGVGFAYFGAALSRFQSSAAVAAVAGVLIAFVIGLVLLRRMEGQLGEAADRAYPDRGLAQDPGVAEGVASRLRPDGEPVGTAVDPDPRP